MKFIDEVSEAKLRGGFYSPLPLVLACLGRLPALVGTRSLHILEPAAGDGAFVRALPGAMERFGISKHRFTCVEIMAAEAEKCRESLRDLRIDGDVIHASFFAWAMANSVRFDAVVGNPPFVRYQFVPKGQRADAERLLARRGMACDGVSNLWIPFLLVSLDLLREGGAFSFILPGELFATRSAGLVRSELIRHADHLQVDLYPRGYFPKLLQDVIVVSGKRSVPTASSRRVAFVEHGAAGERRWSHAIRDSRESWTRYLLSEDELAAYRAAAALPEMHALGEVASIGVAIVTGANDFFTLDDDVRGQFELQPWSRPLLARTTDSPGLIFGPADHQAAREAEKKPGSSTFPQALPIR